MITAVIPTLNRPIDLSKAVASILNQTVLPMALMIVDQSLDEQSRIEVEGLVCEYPDVNLQYIHDPSISGLVEAKRVAVSESKTEIVCFLEDDIVLENDFIEQILAGFTAEPGMLGCCGIVTNMPKQAFGHRFLFNMFHRGIYKDKRVDVFGKFGGRGHDLILSKMLSGGLSAWRREVLSVIPFDPTDGYFMLEDIDFSTRVENHFGPHLYINPNARLVHNCSPVNREAVESRHIRKIIEYINFYKHRQSWPKARFNLVWLLNGLFIESLAKSVMTVSVWPIKGFFLGIQGGFRK